MESMISLDNLKEGLLMIKGASPVSIVSITDPLDSGLRRTNNPYVSGRGKEAVCRLRKINKITGMINSHYDSAVVRRLERAINHERETNNLPPLEGDSLEIEVNSRFRRGESWHEPLIIGDTLTPLSVNKKDGGLAYLRVVLRGSSKPEYLDIENGEVVEAESLAQWLPEPSQYLNQGLPEDSVVRFVCYKLSSIASIKIIGQHYVVGSNLEGYSANAQRKIKQTAREFMSGERAVVTL